MTQIRDTITLLRLPFSLLLLPIFLLTLSQIDTPLGWQAIFWPFFIIHCIVYPASNGYNSYVDRDENPIGGLEKPPLPTKMLFQLTGIMDVVALLLAWVFVDAVFMLLLVLYIGASRAYSSRQIRIKKYAVPAFILVVFFQGMYTFYLSYYGVTQQFFALNETNIWVLAACSFQIAGVYPLTQIFQHQQDLSDGVVTLSYKLGYRGTFIFAALMFLLCNVCYFVYFDQLGRWNDFYTIQLFFLPIAAFFGYWLFLVWQDTKQANFKNTMLLNLIAAGAMNICFLILICK